MRFFWWSLRGVAWLFGVLAALLAGCGWILSDWGEETCEWLGECRRDWQARIDRIDEEEIHD